MARFSSLRSRDELDRRMRGLTEMASLSLRPGFGLRTLAGEGV